MDELVGEEWAEWYRLTPLQRWEESAKLWQITMARNRVRCLLMGGQACVFYGAAEFSRDSDFAILAEPDGLFRCG